MNPTGLFRNVMLEPLLRAVNVSVFTALQHAAIRPGRKRRRTRRRVGFADRVKLRNSTFSKSNLGLLDKFTVTTMWSLPVILLLPFVVLWRFAASVLSATTFKRTQPCQVNRKHNVSDLSRDEKREQKNHARASSPRIGTQVHPSGVTHDERLGCHAGSLVWLMLDFNVFVEVIVRKVILDSSGDILKYNVWLDSGCLVEADEDKIVQPFKVGAHVSDCHWRGMHSSALQAVAIKCACINVPLTTLLHLSR